MVPESESIFVTLKAVLERHADGLTVTEDTPSRYCLEGRVGPATLQAWGGRAKRALIPVAWVEAHKSDATYHLMGIYGNPKLVSGMSKPLKARMNGKTCFSFTATHDASLLDELEELTVQALLAFTRAGFISK
jgi:hypothetical protein